MGGSAALDVGDFVRREEGGGCLDLLQTPCKAMSSNNFTPNTAKLLP